MLVRKLQNIQAGEVSAPSPGVLIGFIEFIEFVGFVGLAHDNELQSYELRVPIVADDKNPDL